jgi:Protein of unknown function (DUF2470)
MGVHAPGPAEAARTAVRRSPTLRVRTGTATADVDLHGADPSGCVVLVLPEDSPVVAAVRAAGDDLPALVDAVDLCPVPVADRVRVRVRLVGWAHEPPAHLRRELAVVAADRESAGALLDIGSGRTVLFLEVAEVLIAGGDADLDEDGAYVDPEEYALASPDPVADGEAALLGHLIADHAGELDALVGLLPATVLARARRVLPVALDRYGLVLRATGPAGDTDLRLPFRQPLTCPRELSHRMGELLASARSAAEEARTA